MKTRLIESVDVSNVSKTKITELMLLLDGPTVTPSEAGPIAKLWSLVSSDMTHRVPRVRAWCVVKHYGNGWPKTVWVACTTRGQAEVLAPRVGAFFERIEGTSPGDYFAVEEAEARVYQLLLPSVTADDYVMSLRR